MKCLSQFLQAELHYNPIKFEHYNFRWLQADFSLRSRLELEFGLCRAVTSKLKSHINKNK